MSEYHLILARLNLYPSLRQIYEASDYAKEISIAYVRKIDPDAVITVEDGDVYLHSNCDFKDLYVNAQCIFDLAFAEMIEKIQARASGTSTESLKISTHSPLDRIN